MIIKFYDLNKNLKKNINFYLMYGENTGLIEETIDKVIKPNFSKNIYIYEETEILADINKFEEGILNKSFFESDKLIIINRVSDKILNIIEEIIERNVDDLKIILKSGILERKSKLRNFFEKNTNTIIVPFYEETNQSLITFTQNYLLKKKIKISTENINLIIEKSKLNRINLKLELDKISNFYLNKKTINAEDIFKLTNSSESLNISELTDMCLSKNRKKTINILNDNTLAIEDNIIIIKNFLYKLKRLKKLKKNLEMNNNIETTLTSYKPPIFWKDKNLIKQQLQSFSSEKLDELIKEVNNLESLVKRNSQISNLLVSNFIIETLNFTNNEI